ncbi:hypothetical protein LX64_04286 [Chitinophaga skermanii]|uniref:Uncharacterized protein n=1 Tax=Chitinophaga skermanii TaxID=331697 RepID=A0A327Q6X8_9BACT|nr:hypothetical protein [Chitinophaga skermanii]RAI99734.1 hypothetical protein LX64_04286 [Chitinophaga skermanii]
MKKTLWSILYGIAIIGLFSQGKCTKDNHKSDCSEFMRTMFAPPLFIMIKENGKAISNEAASKVKVYQNVDGQKRYFNTRNAGENEQLAYPVIIVMDVLEASINKTNTFYVEYGDAQTPSNKLEISYMGRSAETNCQYKMKSIKFDNKVPTTDTSVVYRPYVLNK